MSFRGYTTLPLGFVSGLPKEFSRKGLLKDCYMVNNHNNRVTIDCCRMRFYPTCKPLILNSLPRILHTLHSLPLNSGSTISTLLHDKINPEDCQVLPLGDSGFLQFFRVVSSDYGKPRNSSLCCSERGLCDCREVQFLLRAARFLQSRGATMNHPEDQNGDVILCN